MAKAKRYDSGGDVSGIEKLSEKELNRLSEAAYNKAMPSPEPGEQHPIKSAGMGPIGSGRMSLADTGAGAGRGFVNPKRVDRKASGGMVGSASSRADGCATKGKTRGKVL